MKYSIEFKPRAEKDFRDLGSHLQQRIGSKIAGLKEGLSGDVKKLTNHAPQYRLRVGVYRVLFQVAKDAVIVFRVVHRREAYR